MNKFIDYKLDHENNFNLKVNEGKIIFSIKHKGSSISIESEDLIEVLKDIAIYRDRNINSTVTYYLKSGHTVIYETGVIQDLTVKISGLEVTVSNCHINEIIQSIVKEV